MFATVSDQVAGCSFLLCVSPRGHLIKVGAVETWLPLQPQPGRRGQEHALWNTNSSSSSLVHFCSSHLISSHHSCAKRVISQLQRQMENIDYILKMYSRRCATFSSFGIKVQWEDDQVGQCKCQTAWMHWVEGNRIVPQQIRFKGTCCFNKNNMTWHGVTHSRVGRLTSTLSFALVV